MPFTNRLGELRCLNPFLVLAHLKILPYVWPRGLKVTPVYFNFRVFANDRFFQLHEPVAHHVGIVNPALTFA